MPNDQKNKWPNDFVYIFLTGRELSFLTIKVYDWKTKWLSDLLISHPTRNNCLPNEKPSDPMTLYFISRHANFMTFEAVTQNT